MDLKFDLEKDMIANKEVVVYMADKNIAADFYRALCNMQWMHIQETPEDELIVNKLKGVESPCWSCSWRHAGAIISDIRNKNYGTSEDYMNWYCSGNEGYVSDIVESTFNKMGWKPMAWSDDD